MKGDLAIDAFIELLNITNILRELSFKWENFTSNLKLLGSWMY